MGALKKSHVLRWILVAPAGFAAWWGVLVLGFFTYATIGEPMDSDAPPKRFFVPDSVIFPVFAALSAVAVVSAASLVAPSRRRRVAWASWAVGATWAITLVTMDGGPDDIDSLVAALVAGGLAAVYWSGRDGAA